MKNIYRIISVLLLSVSVQSCYTEHKVDTTHKVELEVKPMHITIDINVKVDKALDDFFNDIDSQDKTMTDSADDSKDKMTSKKGETNE